MTGGGPPLVCIVGRKNAGKTTLTVSLAAELNRRGWRVMTIKHGHGFAVDQAGRDSWRHRHEGGAVRTVMASARDFAVVGEWPPGGEMDPAELARRFLWDADVVLVEGFTSSGHPRIEVLRETDPSLHDFGLPGSPGTLALVTDRSDVGGGLPVLSPDDPGTPGRLADLLVERGLLTAGPERRSRP